MAANVANKSSKSRSSNSTTPGAGKNSAYRTNVASHEPIHSKSRINWFIFGSWSVMIIMCLAFWAAIISLFM